MDEQVTAPNEEAKGSSESPEVVSRPILPLKDTVVYPQTTVPIAVGQERSIRLIDHAFERDRKIVLVAIQDLKAERGEPENSYTIGTLAEIAQVIRVPDGTLRLLAAGLERVRILDYVKREPFLEANVVPFPERVEPGIEVEALANNIQTLFQRFVRISKLSDDYATAALNFKNPLQIAYFIANSLRIDFTDRQEFLCIDSTESKLRFLNGFLNREIEVLEIGKRIQTEAQERIGKVQRDFYLREQLRSIRKELGESDDESSEVDQLRASIHAADLPAEALAEAERELSRFEKLSPMAPEHANIRTFLDWMATLPWNVSQGGVVDIARAREVLNADHYDLKTVKERILEYLAVLKLRSERGEPDKNQSSREPILCFVGPPGVGKTSLGQSIARSLGRAFIRISLGGVRDEAEIRGHRRTYVGAMPGRFIQAIRRAGSNDPVILLDEIDKVGDDWRGDPSAALLEALDPEQNKDFRDHYLDVPFDLSRVMFIATANTLDTIPPALRDRLEVIELSGYTEYEKLKIAENYIVPKQLREHALNPGEVSLSAAALQTIIRDYTREAGVRNVEREIAAVVRKAATRIMEGTTTSVEVTPETVRAFLGNRRYFSEVAERIDSPGIATGLVWTPVGGDILFVEAALVPGTRQLKLTGQLGSVMKESAEAALSFVRSRAAELGIPPETLENHDIHVHVPSGAIPKEGPSAGVVLVTALVSLLTNRVVRSDVAMTGEITLRGKVLPIGGVKEKVLGAHRAGITTVVLPRRNENDLADLPDDLRAQMCFVFVDRIEDALRVALDLPVATVLPSDIPVIENALVA